MSAALSPALARASLGAADAQVSRVLDLVGVHAHALNALLTVSTVEWSDAITTACVECADRPRLLLNPAFVAQWCHTPERLATLVLHELLHIALGHTRLFPRPTLAHNVAFDAIINRTLLAAIQGTQVRHSAVRFGYDVERYTDFFTDFYSASKAPEFILRPPPGWPSAPDWSASHEMPQALRAIHRDLYDQSLDEPDNLDPWDEPTHRYTQVTYADIIAALHDVDGFDAEDVQLLGAHGDTPAECDAIRGSRDRDAAELLASALEPLCGQLPGRGDHLGITQVADTARTPALEHALKALLRRAITPNGAGVSRISWRQRDVRVVHRMHDRRASCRVRAASLLGAPMPLLFDGHIEERLREPQRVAIYVDVSGSMSRVLPHLRRALLTLRREIEPALYWFSDEVVAASGNELETGDVPSTGGTAIRAVITHATHQLPAGSSAIVLTDGYVEAVPRATSAAMRRAQVALHMGVVGGGPLHTGAAWLASSTPLPSPGF
jgi:predicted metal-dependent peptidase